MDNTLSKTNLGKCSFVELTGRISFIALCLLLVDCAISGGGRWLMLGPLSLRMVFGLISALFALPSIFGRLREWIKNPVMVSLALFIIWLVVTAYIGFSKGNRTDVIRADLSGFAWLYLIPVAVSVITTQKRLHTVIKCVIIGAAAQAVMLIAINLFSLYNFDSAPQLFKYFFDSQIGFAEAITGNMYRLFAKSCPFMIMGVIGFMYLQTQSERFNWLYVVLSGLCLSALLITFTRSIYGATVFALALAAVMFFICCKDLRKKLIKHIVFVLLAAAAFVISQQVISGENYVQFAVCRAFGIEIVSEEMIEEGTVTESELGKQNYIELTDNSDDLRYHTMKELRYMKKRSPVIGNGLGAAITIRENGLVEYFYHDIINKMGIVGLVVYCFPAAYMLIYLVVMWKDKEKGYRLKYITLFCGLSAFLFASYFNPYMNAALGISCYAISLSCMMTDYKSFSLFKKQNVAKEKTI